MRKVFPHLHIPVNGQVCHVAQLMAGKRLPVQFEFPFVEPDELVINLVNNSALTADKPPPRIGYLKIHNLST